jgi:alpha-L-fucosidase
MGGSRIIYTAKHSCGFLAFSSKSKYNYSIAETEHPDVDVAKHVVESARKYGIGVGFYYSSAHNSYLRASHDGIVQPGALLPNQVRVTQAQYNAFVLAHLTELWTNYGELDELW